LVLFSLAGPAPATAQSGIASTVRHVGQSGEFRFENGAVRTESGITTRHAIRSTGSFRVDEETSFRKTAEAFFARSRYDRNVNSHFIVFAGIDWLRNTFAGIDSRFLIAVGAGSSWADSRSSTASSTSRWS
jgi:hypothetical protein